MHTAHTHFTTRKKKLCNYVSVVSDVVLLLKMVDMMMWGTAWKSDAERRNQVRSDRDDEVRNRDSDDESTSEDYSDDEVFIMDRDRKEGRARRNGRVRQNDTDLTDTDTDSDDESRDDTEKVVKDKEGAREEPNESCTVCGGPVDGLNGLLDKIKGNKLQNVAVRIEISGTVGTNEVIAIGDGKENESDSSSESDEE